MEKFKVCFCVHGAAQRIVNPKVRLACGLSQEVPAQSIYAQLTLVKESLTPDTWYKGSFFANPNYEKVDMNALVPPIIHGTLRMARSAHMWTPHKETLNLWNDRLPATKKDLGQGKAEIHFIMALFGLTVKFNDAPTTRLQMIHDKLDQVIAFALEHNL